MLAVCALVRARRRAGAAAACPGAFRNRLPSRSRPAAAHTRHGSRRNRNDGTQGRSRAAALRAPAALTRPQRAAGAGVRSEGGSQILAFQH